MRPSLLLALGVALIAAPVAHATTITIVNNDGPGEGFNDATVVAPVGGNPGATLGAQRLYVFQYAANLWSAILPDNVPVQVNAQFNPLTCSATSGVLGSAGATEVYRDFANAPFTGTWYHVALANRLFDSDLNPVVNDMNATFNSSVGGAACLPSGWYLGVDGNEGSQIELLPVVLHELGHGLGFSSTTNGSTGAYLAAFPGTWDHFLYDNATGLHWIDESPAQRAASAIGCNNLVWDGPAVRLAAPDVLGPKPMVRVTSPVLAEYVVGEALFGPPLNGTGVTGPVALMQDNFGNPTNGCEPSTIDLTGKIAFIDRGTCTFVVKALNAQAAGAIGVIVADSVAGCPPAGMSGTDPTITIPSVRVTLAEGNVLRAAIPGGLTATLIKDPDRAAGTDGNGRLAMYTPNPYQGGSSVSHWDTSAEPSLLMEPGITTGLSAGVDLARQLFVDIGWFVNAVGVGPSVSRNVLEPSMPNPVYERAVLAYTLAREEAVELRVFDVVGREVATLASGTQGPGRHAIVWNTTDAAGRRLPPGMYRYRLRTEGWSATHSLVIVR